MSRITKSQGVAGLVILVALAVTIAGVLPAMALYDPEEDGYDVDPVPNNPYPQQCGADVMLVLDNSASLSNGNQTDLKNAANDTVDALSSSTAISGVGVVEFNGQFGGDDANTRIAITELDSSGDVDAVKSAIGTIDDPPSEGFTNWEAGLLEASESENDGDGDVPDENSNKPADLVILVSDGRPNGYGYNDTTDSVGNNTAAREAATFAANIVKNESARVTGVGFPDENGDVPPETPFRAITDGSNSTMGSMDAQLNDFYIAQDSGNLSEILTDITDEFQCGISVEKTNDANEDETYTDDENATEPGQNVSYKVDITNTGEVTLTIDSFDDNQYPNADLNESIVGETIAPGETITVTFVGEAPPETEIKENVFNVVASGEEGNQVSDQDTSTVQSPDLKPQISVEKLVDANGDGTFADTETANTLGETITYQVTVTNTGPNTVTLQNYTDNIYGEPSLDGTLSGVSLDPGENITVTFEGTVPSGENQTKTNEFTVEATDGDGDVATDSDTANVTSPDFAPSITVTKLVDADGDDTFSDEEQAENRGESVTYQVTVTNDGPNDVTIDSWDDDTYDSPALNDSLVNETLAPNETVTVTFNGTAPETELGSKTNEFTVVAADDNGDEAGASDTATVTGPDLDPSISVEKLVDADDDQTFQDGEVANELGGSVTYQVTVENDGPNNLTIDSWTDSVYDSVSLSGNLTGETLAPGETITVTFEGTAPSDEEDTKPNTFTVAASDGDGDDTSDSDTANVTAPDLTPEISVEKLNDANGDETFSDDETTDMPGDDVQYKVVVTNDGPNTVTVTDYNDSEYGSISLNESLVGVSLAPNESVTVTFNGSSPTPEETAKINVFNVTAQDADGDVASALDDTTVRSPDLTPDLAVDKRVDGDDDGSFADQETATELGGNVTYQMTVTNTGQNSVTIDSWSDDTYDSPSLNQSLVGVTLAPDESVTVIFEGTGPDEEEATKTNTVTVNASDEDGDLVDANDSATVVAPDLTPSITVTKVNDANGDGTFSDDETTEMPGDTVTYRVTVTNDGPNSVTIANWTDDTYSGVSLNQTLDGATLAPAQSLTVTFEGNAPTAEETAKTNVFSVNATDDDGDVASASDDTTVRSPDLEPSIAVEKLVDGDDDGDFADQETATDLGGNVTYKVVVTNTGNNTVSIDDWVDDTYPNAALNRTLLGETLAPGETITVTFEGTAPDAENATKTNTFTVDASDGDGDDASANDDATVRAPDPTPEISVTKVNDANDDGTFSDAETTELPGDSVTYEVTVTNTGPNTVNISSWTDNEYDSVSLSSTLVGMTLAPNDSVTVMFSGNSPPAENQSKTNRFTVEAVDENGDEATANDTTTVRSPEIIPQISVNKTVDANDDGKYSDTETATSDGSAVTYQVVVTNTGNNSVTVDGYVDSVYGTPSVSPPLENETLAPGQSITVTFEGTAPELEGDSKTNVFTVNSSDENGDQASAEDSATVVAPDFEPEITVEKLVDADGDGTFADSEEGDEPGDNATYQVTVTNTGNNSITIDSWTDSVYDSVSLSGNLTGETLSPSDSITVTFNGSVPELEGDSKTNTFTVTASDENGDDARAEDSATVNAPDFEPDITVEKLVDADGNGTFSDTETAQDDGETVTYKVIVTNDGPNSVTIDSWDDDTYDSPGLNTSLTGEVLEPGESVAVTFDGTAPELEGDSKTNTFTVNASDENEDSTSANDTATVAAPDFDPSITVTKTVDADATGTYSDTETATQDGGQVTYRITVTNDGPNAITIDSWDDDTYDAPSLNQSLTNVNLPPGEAITVTFDGTAPELEGDSKTNTFTVNASDENGDTAGADDDATVVAPDFDPAITVEKLVDGDDDGTFNDTEEAAAVGGNVTYKVIVTNDGPNNVTVDSWADDTYDAPSLSQSLTGVTIESGESITVTFEGSAPETETLEKTNTFTVNTSDENGDEASGSDDATVVAPDLTPSISVTKVNDANDDGTFSDDETTSMPGDSLTYQVTVENSGPNEVTIESWTDSVYDSVNLSPDLNGTTLAAGDSVTVTFSGSSPVAENQSKTNVFNVTATDVDGDVATEEDDTTVRSPDLVPNISVTKAVDADGDGSFADSETASSVGGNVTYLVTVTNVGENSVTIDSWADDTYDSPTLNDTLTGVELEPGESVTVTFEGSAPETETLEKTNTVTVNASDENEDHATDNDTATVVAPNQTPSIAVIKAVDANGDGSFSDAEEADAPGDAVSYQVTVTNDGPNEVTIDSWSDDTYDSITLSSSLVGVSLAPGDSVTVTFNGSAPSAYNASKTNVFTVNATDFSGDVATDTGSATVTTPPEQRVCARTPGFWQTHNGEYAKGNNPDLTTSYLPITLGNGGGKSVVVADDDTADQIFDASLTADSSNSNGISKLYRHLLAAKLNDQNGADVPQVVADAISDSDDILTQYNESDWSSLSEEQQQEILDLKDTLDKFNNGHWDDEDCTQDWWKDDENSSSIESPWSATTPTALKTVA